MGEPTGQLIRTEAGVDLVLRRHPGTPGWEYYLDLLAAARDDAPSVSFDDYYPVMKPYFEALVTR